MNASSMRWRVWVCGGIVLLTGGMAAAQGPVPPPRRFAPAPRPRALPPSVAAPPLRVLTAPRSYDACLVHAEDVDPRFSVAAPPMDQPMVVAAPVAGLYRGTLGARR